MKESMMIIYEDRIEWWQNDKLHRLDGPAVKYDNGDEYYYQNFKLHRLDGPAKELANGIKCWYIKGKQYTKEEFNKKLNKILN